MDLLSFYFHRLNPYGQTYFDFKAWVPRYFGLRFPRGRKGAL